MLSVPSDFLSVLPVLKTAEEEACCWLLISLMESVLKFKLVPEDIFNCLKELEEKYKDSFLVQIFQLFDLVKGVNHVFKPEKCAYFILSDSSNILYYLISRVDDILYFSHERD